MSRQRAPKDSWRAYASAVGVMIAGAAVALFGAHATWFTVERASASYVTVRGLGNVRFPSTEFNATAQEVAPDVAALALLLLVFACLALLATPRIRLALVVLSFASAVAAVILVATAKQGDAVAASQLQQPIVVRAGAGRAIADAGASLAILGALAAAPRALHARRVRMPETAPADDA